MRAMKLAIVATTVLTLLSGPTFAGELADRTALEAVLGVNQIDEDFESWAGEVIEAVGFDTLDSTTVVANRAGLDQGPGIVNEKLTFSGDRLQLDIDSTPPGLASKSLQASEGTLVIDFEEAVTAAGFDLFKFTQQSGGLPDAGVVQVFNDGVSLGIFNRDVPGSSRNAPASNFFGFENAGGITRITVATTGENFSPFIDNLSYGGTPDTQPPSGAVPEPASFAVFGLGTMLVVVGGARRRRKD